MENIENHTRPQPNSLHNLMPIWEGIRAELIRYRTAERESIQAAINAGEMLHEAKGVCSHGEWLPRLAMLKLNPRTAQKWMRLAKLGLSAATVSHLGGINATLALWAKMPTGTAPEEFKGRVFDQAVAVLMLGALEWSSAEQDHLESSLRKRLAISDEIATLPLPTREGLNHSDPRIRAAHQSLADTCERSFALWDEWKATTDEIAAFVHERGAAVSGAVAGLKAALPQGREAVKDALPALVKALPQLIETRTTKLLEIRPEDAFG